MQVLGNENSEEKQETGEPERCEENVQISKKIAHFCSLIQLSIAMDEIAITKYIYLYCWNQLPQADNNIILRVLSVSEFFKNRFSFLTYFISFCFQESPPTIL